MHGLTLLWRELRLGRAMVPRGVWIAAAFLLFVVMATAPLAPLFDPDEGYYPATASESLESGAPWDPRFNGEARWDKPILTYALIELSFSLFGQGIAAARLPSAIQGALLLVLVGLVVSRLAGDRAGVLATWVVASTLGVQVFTRAAHPEIGVVLAVITAELLAVLWILESRPSVRPWLAVLAGVAVGWGVLSKGPVAVALPLLALAPVAILVGGWRRPSVAACRDLAVAGCVAVACAAPWYMMMTARHGVEFLGEALWRHNVVRYTGGGFGNEQPLWFLIVPTLVAMFPWSAFVPRAFSGLRWSDASRRGRLGLVMASAALTAFAFYSASSSKLPHYALVVVPPLSILIALHVDQLLGAGRHARWEGAVTGAVMVGLALAFFSMPWLVGRVVSARELLGGGPDLGPNLPLSMGVAIWPCALLLAGGAVALFRLPDWQPVRVIAAVGLLMPALFIATARPLLVEAYPWERFGRQLAQTEGPIWMVGPRAPSLTYFAGRPVNRVYGVDPEVWLTSGAEGWLVAESRWIADMGARLPLARFDTIDRSGGMALIQLAPACDHPSHGDC